MMRIDTDDTHAGWEAQEGIRNDECGIRKCEAFDGVNSECPQAKVN